MTRSYNEPFSGAVLAGGRSERFGSDKALARYRGRALLLRVLDSLTEASERFVVSNRPRPLAGVPTRPDLLTTGGALAGLHSALIHAKHPWVAVAACDLPNLNPAFWRLLWGYRHGRQAVVVRHEDSRLEPLAALYHRSALPAVMSGLQSGKYALHSLIDSLETYFVPAQQVPSEETLQNINHPEDLPDPEGS